MCPWVLPASCALEGLSLLRMAWPSTSHIPLHSYLVTEHTSLLSVTPQNKATFRGLCSYLVISILETGMKTPEVGESDRGALCWDIGLFLSLCSSTHSMFHVSPLLNFAIEQSAMRPSVSGPSVLSSRKPALSSPGRIVSSYFCAL